METGQSPSVERTPSARWALTNLSLSLLLSSLGTSIAHVGLPTLALEFNASFREVQWVVSYRLPPGHHYPDRQRRTPR